MKLAEIIKVIRAVRQNDTAPATVSIDLLSSGKTTFGVKVSGRDVRVTAKRAQEVYDGLAKKYNGGEK